MDFTNAAWTPKLADFALDRGVRLVIGTTGLPQSFVNGLATRCAERKLGGLIAAADAHARQADGPMGDDRGEHCTGDGDAQEQRQPVFGRQPGGSTRVGDGKHEVAR